MIGARTFGAGRWCGPVAEGGTRGRLYARTFFMYPRRRLAGFVGRFEYLIEWSGRHGFAVSRSC